MINRVVLVGRLTRDPAELRKTNGDNAVTSFTIAVDNRFAKTEDRATDFISCVVFSKTAEFVCNYAKKGALVGVEGRLQSRSYDDKEGRKIYVTEVVCDNVQLLESKSVVAQRNNEPTSQVKPNNYAYQNQVSEKTYNDVGDKYANVDINDDDLPF